MAGLFAPFSSLAPAVLRFRITDETGVVAMNRMDALKARRRDARQASASSAVDRILDEAHANGIAITVFGSLAKDDFRVHSDVDLLVRGTLAPRERALAERLVADALRASGIPYDLLFEQDMTPDRMRELLA